MYRSWHARSRIKQNVSKIHHEARKNLSAENLNLSLSEKSIHSKMLMALNMFTGIETLKVWWSHSACPMSGSPFFNFKLSWKKKLRTLSFGERRCKLEMTACSRRLVTEPIQSNHHVNRAVYEYVQLCAIRCRQVLSLDEPLEHRTARGHRPPPYLSCGLTPAAASGGARGSVFYPTPGSHFADWRGCECCTQVGR